MWQPHLMQMHQRSFHSPSRFHSSIRMQQLILQPHLMQMHQSRFHSLFVERSDYAG